MGRKALATRKEPWALTSDRTSWRDLEPQLGSYQDTFTEAYDRLANHRPRGARAAQLHALELVDLTMEVLELIRIGFACLNEAHAQRALEGLLGLTHALLRYDTAMALLRLGTTPDAWLRFSLHPCRFTLIDAYAQCETVALSFGQPPGSAATDLPAGRTGRLLSHLYRPAAAFKKGMAGRLRQAARRTTKRVRTRLIDGVVCYSVADAHRWWPNDVPKSP